MKKLIILLLLTSTVWTKNVTLAKNRKNRYQQMESMPKKEQCSSKHKEKPLLQRSFTKVVSDLWDVMIAHAKRWYTALAVVLILWYKSNAPFPFRDKIASYFQ